MRNFPGKSVEQIKTHIFTLKNFFCENRAVYEINWHLWYSRTGHRWQNNTAHALCMLDNLDYKHTLTMCNTYCFSTTTMVTLTRLNNALYAYWRSCILFITASVGVMRLTEELYDLWSSPNTFGLSNQEDWDGRDTWQIWGRDHMEDLGVHEKILKWIIKEEGESGWTGFVWLSTGTSSGLLQTR